MNKKFTFMVAALLAAGSAFAIDVDRKVSEIKTDRAYYVEFTKSSIGYVLNSDDATNYVVSSNIDGTTAVKSAEKAQWILVKNSDNTYSFKNAVSGKLLSVKAADKSFLFDGKGEYTKFYITETGDNTEKFNIQIVKEGTPWYIQVGATTIEVTESVTSNQDDAVFYEAYNTPVTVAEFRANEGSEFSLNFGESEVEGDSTFVDVNVVTLGGSVDAFEIPEETANGFLFMVSGKAENGVIANNDDFKAAKFIYLTNKDRISGQTDEFSGYRYDVISGAELIKADNKIDADNAVFSAYTTLNQDGYILKQENVMGDATNTVWVSVVNSVVASKVENIHYSPVVIEAGKGTRVDIKTVAKGRRIVNVFVQNDSKQFINALSTATGSNAVAVKSASMLKYPAGQYLISADASGNTITLINLQDPSKKESGLKLYETEKAGEYLVTGGSALDNKTIQFNDVDSDVYNGYANLSDTDLDGKTFKLKLVADVLGEEVEVYAQANGTAVKYVTTEENATEWKLSKRMIEEGVADTIKVTAPEHRYYDADGEVVKVDDKKFVLTKAFGYTFVANNNVGTTDGDENRLNLTNSFTLSSVAGSEKTIAIRQVSKDRYVLVGGTIASGTSTGDVESIDLNSYTRYAKLNDSNESIVAEAGSLENALRFELVTEEPAPSLAADSKHVTFSINGLNYVAMDANGNGVVANETSTLKAATVEDFTFWIDSVDAEAVTPSFFISKGGKMMVNGSYVADAAQTAWDNDDITEDEAKEIIDGTYYNEAVRVKFTPAARAEGDTLMINDEKVVSNAFKFNIVEAEDGGYVLKNGTEYVGAVNEQLVMTDKANAVVVEVATAEAPTSNESVSASEVKVIANNGSVVVKNAAGKNVVVSTILGQVVANEVLTSDNATINVPAGIVVVAVEGESFKVNVK